jgi:hypothetical protein
MLGFLPFRAEVPSLLVQAFYLPSHLFFGPFEAASQKP